MQSNENRSKILLDRVYQILNKRVRNKKISFLGVTFKANTDDMRDSSSLKMIPWLSKKGAIIKYFDPTGFKNEFSKLKNVSNKKTIKDQNHIFQKDCWSKVSGSKRCKNNCKMKQN